MDFQRDLIDIVRDYFSQRDISYEGLDKAEDFAARYCEMRIRRIDPAPRHVHFSSELYETLGRLANETDSREREKASDAWKTVFRLWHLFTSGGTVPPYLGRSIQNATSCDGLLWDYGMHHFHLRSGVEYSGFIKRSDYLLFAMVSDKDVFFVDVRKHRDPQKLQWVRQDLLKIVHANRPEITNAHVLHGIQGSSLRDEQKKELRRKNVNTVADLGGLAIGPLGWGTLSNGGSVWCQMWGDKLLHEIRWHETFLSGQPEELRVALAAKGVAVPGVMNFRLALLDNIDASTELAEYLQEGNHASKGLCAMGFAIVEATSGYPVTITYPDEA